MLSASTYGQFPCRRAASQCQAVLLIEHPNTCIILFCMPKYISRFPRFIHISQYWYYTKCGKHTGNTDESVTTSVPQSHSMCVPCIIHVFNRGCSVKCGVYAEKRIFMWLGWHLYLHSVTDASDWMQCDSMEDNIQSVQDSHTWMTFIHHLPADGICWPYTWIPLLKDHQMMEYADHIHEYLYIKTTGWCNMLTIYMNTST